MDEILDDVFSLSFLRDVVTDKGEVSLSDLFTEITNLLSSEKLDYTSTLTYSDLVFGPWGSKNLPIKVVLTRDNLNYKLYWKDDIQCLSNNKKAVSWIAYDLIKNGPLDARQEQAA